MEGMELPPDIAKMLLEKLKEHLTGSDEDESKWVTVGTLKPEDITRRHTFNSDMAAMRGKSKVLVAKLEAMEAERSAMHQEFWEHLYSTYNLPRGGSYTLGPDHTIKKKPGKSAACDCGKCKD